LEGNVGKTKLTRKEILAEDPIHHAMVSIVDVFRSQGKLIAIAAASLVLLGAGIFFGLSYYQGRNMAAQIALGEGMSLFHATIDPEAPDDPYGQGPVPAFRSEEARYQAASQEFSNVIEQYGSSKLGVLAHYYLGLCQLRLGQEDEAVQSLEVVRSNTRDRTVGYLGKKVLAQYYLNSGNGKAAQEILEGMIRDPQCDLPKEVLKVDLANAYAALGKGEEAANLLQEAQAESQGSMFQTMINDKLNELKALSSVSPNEGSSEKKDPPAENPDPER
jgi:predicted negative regulator of RcsB-dependent stress response